MALFVLSYARRDGEPLVRRFFDRLSDELRVMHPNEKEIGFMDTEGIPTGAPWQRSAWWKARIDSSAGSGLLAKFLCE